MCLSPFQKLWMKVWNVFIVKLSHQLKFPKLITVNRIFIHHLNKLSIISSKFDGFMEWKCVYWFINFFACCVCVCVCVTLLHEIGSFFSINVNEWEIDLPECSADTTNSNEISSSNIFIEWKVRKLERKQKRKGVWTFCTECSHALWFGSALLAPPNEKFTHTVLNSHHIISYHTYTSVSV